MMPQRKIQWTTAAAMALLTGMLVCGCSRQSTRQQTASEVSEATAEAQQTSPAAEFDAATKAMDESGDEELSQVQSRPESDVALSAADHPAPTEEFASPTPPAPAAPLAEGEAMAGPGSAGAPAPAGVLSRSAEGKESSSASDGNASLSRKAAARRVERQRYLNKPSPGSTDKSEDAPDDGLLFDLQPGEELWVITKTTNARQEDGPPGPGTGSLLAALPDQTEQIPVPLKHTEVSADIDGYIASVNVRQQFHNPFNSKIEAVYVFPLPEDAAINEFVMTVGERKIRGIIRERQAAEKIYAAARRRGHVAALMTQERPNIFTQKVANIEPGRKIDIQIRYLNTLQYDNGEWEFTFPMVVGPRFNPPSTTEGIGALPRKSQHGTQKTNVSYLAPSERSGHDIAVTVNIDAGTDISEVRSVNHAIDVRKLSESRCQVRLSSKTAIPNRDFVLRFRVAGPQIRSALLTHKDDHGQYFTMMLFPPAQLQQIERSPMEMVFVLDCSGSMKGKPIQQAKRAIRHALQSLTERDTFQIIRFSNNASQLGQAPLPATEENISKGLQYLDSLNGTGGTHMVEGMRAALQFPHDEGRFRLVSFMTDGYIGNEQQILQVLHENLKDSRIFCFGVGSSPNRYLMDRMAILGRGACAYLSLNDDAPQIMDAFLKQISHPALTDLSIDWGGMQVTDVYPQRLPDLIPGRPVIVTGRFRGTPTRVTVKGRAAMEPTEFAVSMTEDNKKTTHPGIATVWARLKIKDLMNDAIRSPAAAAEISTTIRETALAHNLVSAYTAFVAVDSLSRTKGEFGTTVAVPVPTPEGVPYETTVDN